MRWLRHCITACVFYYITVWDFSGWFWLAHKIHYLFDYWIIGSFWDFMASNNSFWDFMETYF